MIYLHVSQIYDRSSITAWFNKRKRDRQPITSPLTNLVLLSESLTSCVELKRSIEEFRESLRGTNTLLRPNVKFSLTSELFSELDKIPSLFDGLNLRMPQIVVIGNESHGKSSLLERIIGLPIFPRNQDLCTRCVIRVHLRRGEYSLSEITVNDINFRAKSQTVAPTLLRGMDQPTYVAVPSQECKCHALG